MLQNCNSIIKENKNLTINFEEKFKKNIIFYTHQNNINREEGQGNYIDSYVSSIYSKIYTYINKTIILLDVNKCTIIEKSILIKQLQELYRLFFDYLETSNYKSDYWKLFEWKEQEIFDYKHSYIEPEDFNAEFVLNLINNITNDRLIFPIPQKKTKEQNTNLNKTWFEIGLEFANGRIYNLLEDKQSHEKIARELFKNRKIKCNSYRVWISCSLGKVEQDNQSRSIFLRTNAEKELNIIVTYCKENNIPISEKFKKQCRENNIILN